MKSQLKSMVLSKGTVMRNHLSEEVDILSQFSGRGQKGDSGVKVSIICKCTVNFLNNFIQNQGVGGSHKILESEASKLQVRKKACWLHV